MRQQKATVVLIQRVDPAVGALPEPCKIRLRGAKSSVRVFRPLLAPGPPSRAIPGNDTADVSSFTKDRCQGGRTKDIQWRFRIGIHQGFDRRKGLHQIS